MSTVRTDTCPNCHRSVIDTHADYRDFVLERDWHARGECAPTLDTDRLTGWRLSLAWTVLTVPCLAFWVFLGALAVGGIW